MNINHNLKSYTALAMCGLLILFTGCSSSSGGGGGTTYYSLSVLVTGCSGNITLTIDGSPVTATCGTSYVVSGLTNNSSHTVTPSSSGYTFSPPSKTATINGADVALSFTATAVVATYTATGTAGAGVALSPTSQTGALGATKTFAATLASNYTTPLSAAVTAGDCSVSVSGTTISITLGSTNCTFSVSATAIVVPTTFSIAGKAVLALNNNVALLGATITCGSNSAVTTATGVSIAGFTNGTYTCTPTLAGYTFAPASVSVTVSGANASTGNFVATATGAFNLVDKTMDPTAAFADVVANTDITFTSTTSGAVSSLSVLYPGLTTTGGNIIWSVTFHVGFTPTLNRYFNKVAAIGFGITSFDASNNQLVSANGLGGGMEFGVPARSLEIPETITSAGVAETPNIVNLFGGNNDYYTGMAKVQSIHGDVFQTMIGIYPGQTTSYCSGENNACGRPYAGNNQVTGTNQTVTSTTTVAKSEIRIMASVAVILPLNHERDHTNAEMLNLSALNLADSTGVHPSVSSYQSPLGSDMQLKQQPDGTWLEVLPTDGLTTDCRINDPVVQYLNGWGPASAIDFYMVPDATKRVFGSKIAATDVLHVTGAMIQNVYGVRNPAYVPDVVQTERAAFVVFTKTQAPSAAMSLYDYIASYWAGTVADNSVDAQGCTPKPFKLFTGGVTLTTALN
jgi:hypothetical protein